MYEIEKINIQRIVEQYNKKGNEVIEIKRISEIVAATMEKQPWLLWTKFPERFRKCRSEGELRQMIDNFYLWLAGLGIFDTIIEEIDCSNLVIHDDKDVIYGDLDE